MLELRGRHLGPDRRAHGQVERQRRQRIEIFSSPGFGKVTVECDAGGFAQPAFDQVHQQEGEIVEHVAGADQLAEFDSIEQHRLAIDQRDVAEMQVAVDTADEPVCAARFEQRPDAGVSLASCLRERLDLLCRKHIGRFRKCLGVLVDIAADRRDPIRWVDSLGVRVGGGDRAAKPVRQSRIDFAGLGEPIECLRLVEAAHLHRPFHRLAVAIEREAIALPRDRNDAKVDLGRVAAVDRDLVRAHGLSLLEGGEIEEGKAHGALDLVHPLAGEEGHRRMGVDPLDLVSAMRRRIAQESEHGVLRLRDMRHRKLNLRPPRWLPQYLLTAAPEAER